MSANDTTAPTPDAPPVSELSTPAPAAPETAPKPTSALAPDAVLTVHLDSGTTVRVKHTPDEFGDLMDSDEAFVAVDRVGDDAKRYLSPKHVVYYE